MLRIIVPTICTNPIHFVTLTISLLCSILLLFDYSALYETRKSQPTLFFNNFSNSSPISLNPSIYPKPNQEPIKTQKPNQEPIKTQKPKEPIIKTQKPNQPIIKTHRNSSSISPPTKKSRKKIVHHKGRTPKKTKPSQDLDQPKKNPSKTEDSKCLGKYIYIQNLPKKFNENLAQNCKSPHLKWSEVCKFIWENLGLGPKVENPKQTLTKQGWFHTNQFSLEVIFHNRMKQYKCLTNNSSKSTAIYVPFYAGLDVGPNLWGPNTSLKDKSPIELAQWLSQRKEWKSMWGRDHFLIGGRITWDFRRSTQNESDWGSKLMALPEAKNMTMLTIETGIWNNDFAIPYPTYFHPTKDTQIIEWQNKVKRQKRPYLYSFIGGTRPRQESSIRGELVNQCKASKRCNLLACNQENKNKCNDPVEVMNTFLRSVFCLQPPGDSFTRRSIFDAILAGCVPVFFHHGSAYVQYVWHFPKDYKKYSVFIPLKKVKGKEVNFSEILEGFSENEVLGMRNEVVGMIPRVIYGNPKSRLVEFEDAFDVAVNGILERVEKVRKRIKEGNDPSVGFADLNHYKLEMLGLS